jgi:tRNA-Thr(GGU) m(6)t(6)A37 methyltransferase TsaA
MTDAFEVVPIGYVSTTYETPENMPNQPSENVGGVGRVIVRDDFVDALLGLDRYPYLWLLTWLHDNGGRPVELRIIPRVTAHTGEVQGVFASRSPRRPNPIGLSLVRQIAIERNVVTFGGVDLVDGTPVLDLKPWFADCDLPPEAT